jgi:hypothetical protein
MLRRLFLALIVALLITSTAQAQSAVTGLDRLEIELWPDYDRPALLVLLTGVLPPGTALPANVRLPIPAEAELHVVARISDTSEMIDDVSYNTEVGDDGQQFLTFTAPDLRFRVEYYLPYTAEGDERQFAFSWQSDLEIVLLAVLIQQPLNAVNFSTEPAAPTVQPGEEGFNYHAFPEQPVVAGQQFAVQGSYTLRPAVLSANALATAQAAGSPPGASTAVPADSDPAGNTPGLLRYWPIILAAIAGLVLLALAGWLLLFRRTAPAPTGRKATPRRPQTPERKQTAAGGSAVGFCHQCGQAIQPGDHFCRNCGATIKQ